MPGILSEGSTEAHEGRRTWWMSASTPSGFNTTSGPHMAPSAQTSRWVARVRIVRYRNQDKA